MSDDRKHEGRHDPDPAEIEIDESNEEYGGPTTESLEAGLSSNPLEAEFSRSPRSGGVVTGRAPGSAQGRNGTGGGLAAGDPTGNVGRKRSDPRRF